MVTESNLNSRPAGRLDCKRAKTTIESVLLFVIIALFAQLLLILFVLLITGIAPVFVQRWGFQRDFIDLFCATSDWLRGIDPYHSIKIVTPPPSFLAALPLQFLGSGYGRIVFLFIDIAIVAVSLAGICKWFNLTPRKSRLLFGIASLYFPVIFLVERENLDGIMLGLILVSVFAKNRMIRALALGLSIGFKVYSILLLAPLMLARRWKRVMAVLLLLALLMLPFHSLFWSFIHAQTRRSAELRGAENICPIALLSPIDVFSVSQQYALSHGVAFVYMTLWIVSYALMLYKNREADLIVKTVYSFAWMLAIPLQVFPYTGVFLLPLLVLKACEMAKCGLITLSDRLFLMGFCLVGFSRPLSPHTAIFRIWSGSSMPSIRWAWFL